MELVPDPVKQVEWSDNEVKTILFWFDQAKSKSQYEKARKLAEDYGPQVFMHEHFLQIKLIGDLLDKLTPDPRFKKEREALENLRWMLIETFFEQDDEYLPVEFTELHPRPEPEEDVDED